MSEHTPGPWMVEPSAAKGAWIQGSTGEWAALACGNTDATARANARLIAAAPDLLSLLRHWSALDSGAWAVDRHAREKAELLADTRAAIAKAEARS